MPCRCPFNGENMTKCTLGAVPVEKKQEKCSVRHPSIGENKTPPWCPSSREHFRKYPLRCPSSGQNECPIVPHDKNLSTVCVLVPPPSPFIWWPPFIFPSLAPKTSCVHRCSSAYEECLKAVNVFVQQNRSFLSD